MSCQYNCDHSHATAIQTLDEMEFERGIWCAAQYGDLGRVKKLLSSRDDADKRDSAGYTPLHYSARNGHLDVCQYLVNEGADVNAVTRGGATALCRAASTGKSDIVQYLLTKKPIHSFRIQMAKQHFIEHVKAVTLKFAKCCLKPSQL